MTIYKANFLTQKSHLQDGKIQISQSLFAIWMAFLAENDTIPADISAFLETSGNDSAFSPVLTADETES